MTKFQARVAPAAIVASMSNHRVRAHPGAFRVRAFVEQVFFHKGKCKRSTLLTKEDRFKKKHLLPEIDARNLEASQVMKKLSE